MAQQFGELIIVNDGFPSEQLDFVAATPRVRIIHIQSSVGCPSARNIGIKASKNPYVVLLDHDDVLCEDYLKNITAWVNDNKLRCAAATLNYVGENPKNVGVVVGRGRDFVLPSGFLSEVSLITEAGYFPDSYSDDVLLFRAIRQLTELSTCPDAHVLYRIHPQAESSRNAKAWWAFNQVLPLYLQGDLSLAETNAIAREFAYNGVIPEGMQSRFSNENPAIIRVLSRSAYACWLNRDTIGAIRYGARLVRHLPELVRLARSKWMTKMQTDLISQQV
jgi:glycosyltransferase involved in cell wall biosynthesis